MNEVVAQAINPNFGIIGHAFVIVSFVFAIAASIGFYLQNKKTQTIEQRNWQRASKIFFFIHVIGIFGVLTTLLAMIHGHHFEYYYVWQHSSLDLQAKYILSCLWEGQEGSFLLWAFWHALLGCILIFTSGKFQAPVLFCISFIQVFLTSFLLGFYFGDFHIGSSPFLLLKDELVQDPIFLFNDYMKYIPDGTGLNALLQNYWMVIHPPILFLGFACCSIPFSFAIAGLWNKEYTAWLKPAIVWSCFGAGILGTGVLMGGAWAYEALSFGGFWAWDPVENASIMPWLVLVAGLHTMLIAKSTGHALKSAFILIILSFILVLYASFLTRSGVLGDTSVHSFVTSGLTGHILIFLFTFIFISTFLFLKNKKYFPSNKTEEENSSREFWMFVGALVLFFCCVHIIFFTSIPVYNEIFDGLNSIFGLNLKSDYSPPINPVQYYTSVQIWVAIVMAILLSFGQFLKYKKSNTSDFFKKIAYPFVGAIILALLSALKLEYKIFHPYTLLLFAAYFALLANLQYFILVLKGRIKVSGASVAHIGFAILLIGILISNANQQVISKNTLGIDYGEGTDEKFKRENILLYKNMPVNMGDYIVTYLEDSVLNRARTFTIQYEKIDEDGTPEYTFQLFPYLLLDKKSQQLSPNPDTKHYLSHDVFTHISSIPNNQDNKTSTNIQTHTIQIGDTIFFSRGIFILNNIQRFQNKDTIGAEAEFITKIADAEYLINPKLKIVGDSVIQEPISLTPNAQLEIVFKNILVQSEEFVFVTNEENAKDDWVIMKAIVFPMINLVWLGSILMALGFFISLIRRAKENKNPSID